MATYENADLIWVDCGGDPAGAASLIRWYASDYNDPEALRARTVPSVARGVEVWAALVERGIWRVVGAGDLVTVQGVTYPLVSDCRPQFGAARDRDPDLPGSWPY